MKKAVTLALTAAILLTLLVLTVLFWQPLCAAILEVFNRENIETLLDRTGAVAPIVFIGLQAAQVLLAPIPMQVFGLAGGYIFGAFWGSVYSMAGLTLGSFIAIWLSRVFGRRLVKRFVKPQTLSKFDHLAEKGGLPVFFFIFLLPALPDDAICFIAGLTTLPIWALVLVAFLGRLPGLVALALTGEHLDDGNFTVVIITAVVVFAALIVFLRPQIENLFRKRQASKRDSKAAEQ